MCKLKIFFENLTGGPYTYKELSVMTGIEKSRITYYVWYHPEYKHFIKLQNEKNYINETVINSIVGGPYTYNELGKILGVCRSSVFKYISHHPEYKYLVRTRINEKILNYLENNPNLTDSDITNLATKLNVHEIYIKRIIEKHRLLKLKPKRRSPIRDYIKTLTSPKTYTEIADDLGLTISAVSHFFTRHPECATENVRNGRTGSRGPYKKSYINKSSSQDRLNILKEFLDKLPNHSITIATLSKRVEIHYRTIERLLTYLPEYKCKIRDKGELYETDLVRFDNGIINIKLTAKKIGKSIYTTRKWLIDSGCLWASKEMFYDGNDYSKDYYYK